jgi:hypothetical protein
MHGPWGDTAPGPGRDRVAREEEEGLGKEGCPPVQGWPAPEEWRRNEEQWT